MIEYWILLALVALFLYGISQVVNKSSLNSISAANYIFISAVATTPMYLFLMIGYIYKSGGWQGGFSYTIFGLLSVSFGLTGYYTFLEALKAGPVSIVGSITAAYPVMTVIVAITLLNETLTLIQGMGVTIILIGIVALSYSSESDRRISGLSRRCLIFSLVTFFLWGLWTIFIKVSLEDLDVTAYLGLYIFATPIISSFYLYYRKSHGENIVPNWSIGLKLAIIAICVGQIAFFCEVYAADTGPASIVFPLVAAYPVLTILFALAFLREKISHLGLIFVMMVIIGIMLVSTV